MAHRSDGWYPVDLRSLWSQSTKLYSTRYCTSIGSRAPSGRSRSTKSGHWAHPAGVGHHKAWPGLNRLKSPRASHRPAELLRPLSAFVPGVGDMGWRPSGGGVTKWHSAVPTVRCGGRAANGSLGYQPYLKCVMSTGSNLWRLVIWEYRVTVLDFV